MEEQQRSQDLGLIEEQRLAQVLHAIAEQEIPDDMNKWPEIRAKIDTPQVRRPLRLSGYAAAALTLVALLTTSLVAYAVYQWGEGEIQADPGIDGIRQAGLVQELDVPPITLDGVTITVTEGYADANRVAIWYTLDKPADMPEEFLMPVMWALTTPDGGFINHDLSSAPVDETETNKYGVIMGLVEPLQGNEVDLKLSASIGGMPMMMIPDNVTLTPGPVPEEYMVDVPLIGPFEFYVTLTVQESAHFAPDVTVENNGVAITLASISIAPSQTTFQLCYDLPTRADWHLHFAEVRLDENVGLPTGGGFVDGKPTGEETNRCVNYDFALAALEDFETLTIEIDRMQTSISEGMEEVDFELAAERLAAEGIIVEFSGTGREFRYTIIEEPADMGEGEAGMAIWESLAQWYEGEWVFEIDLTTE